MNLNVNEYLVIIALGAWLTFRFDLKPQTRRAYLILLMLAGNSFVKKFINRQSRLE